LPLRVAEKSCFDRSFNRAISTALTQHRQDLIPPGQCFCQPTEMLIDLLLDCGIDAGSGGLFGDEAGWQPFRAGYIRGALAHRYVW
jgi:hypothetical protein